MREKANSEVSRGRESDLIDDEDVLMEDDFYTTHSGRQVRRRRSVPDQKTSGWITVKFFPKAVSEALFSGPNDFHPITVALIKINTRELTDILRKNAQRIVSMIEDPTCECAWMCASWRGAVMRACRRRLMLAATVAP